VAPSGRTWRSTSARAALTGQADTRTPRKHMTVQTPARGTHDRGNPDRANYRAPRRANPWQRKPRRPGKHHDRGNTRHRTNPWPYEHRGSIRPWCAPIFRRAMVRGRKRLVTSSLPAWLRCSPPRGATSAGRSGRRPGKPGSHTG
jgi:hypothetical protein